MKDIKITCYSLNISNKFNDINTIKKEQINIYKMIKRFIERNLKYKDISFIIGISETDKINAKEDYIRTGKKGRPRRVILGTKISWHFHIYVLSEKKGVPTFCEDLKKKLKKKDYIVSKGNNDDYDVAINYLKKQSLYRLSYGSIFTSKKDNKKRF